MKVLARVFLSSIALLAASPATFEELASQATAAREANNIPKAIDLYRQALQLKPAWTEGWWFLGTLSYDADQDQSSSNSTIKLPWDGVSSACASSRPAIVSTRSNTYGVRSRSAPV